MDSWVKLPGRFTNTPNPTPQTLAQYRTDRIRHPLFSSMVQDDRLIACRINPLREMNLTLVDDSLYGTLLLIGLAVHPSGDSRLASIALYSKAYLSLFYFPMSESGLAGLPCFP